MCNSIGIGIGISILSGIGIGIGIDFPKMKVLVLVLVLKLWRPKVLVLVLVLKSWNPKVLVFGIGIEKDAIKNWWKLEYDTKNFLRFYWFRLFPQRKLISFLQHHLESCDIFDWYGQINLYY